MARPRGHRLNVSAWHDALRWTGRTLTEVADTADMSRPTISGLASGNQRASVPMAHRLADAVGVNVETLFPTFAKHWIEVDQAAS